MARSTSTLLFIVICFVTSCGQALEGKHLIDEINAGKVTARQLGEEAERKRKEANEKNESDDHAENDRLIEEAAKLYGQASDTLEKAAKQATELSTFGVLHGVKSTSVCNQALLVTSRD